MPLTSRDLLNALEVGLEAFDDFEVGDPTLLGESPAWDGVAVKVMNDRGQWQFFEVKVTEVGS
jgi:hypothetical protein